MALKYDNTKKFDDAAAQVDVQVQSPKKGFEMEAQRQALSGINNRVLGGTAGTGNYYTAGLTVSSSSAGLLKSVVPISMVIEGKKVDYAATDPIPSGNNVLGTQGTGSWCYYLVSVNTAGTATVSKGNDGTALAAAFLPDLPDHSCAIGYMLIVTTTQAFVYGTASTINGGNTASYADLYCMPIFDLQE